MKQDFIVTRGEAAREMCEGVLKTHDIGHLGLMGEDYPYVIPMNHIYHDGKLVLHGSLSGKKIDLMNQNDAVCYTVDGPLPGVQEDKRSCHLQYESVLCYGKIRLVEGFEEKSELLGMIVTYYDPNRPPLAHGAVDGCNCFIIDIAEMSGRSGRYTKSEVRSIFLYDFAK